MAAHRLEVADVFREHGSTYLARNGIPLDRRRVLRDIAVCRTAALGGHVKKCDQCGHEEFFYKSCGNRHCPKCQANARAKWLDAQAADLLETTYFHLVFTLPEKLNPIALQNKRLFYGILFRAASETLLKIARDPKHLGAEIGFLSVLHTWGQKLDHHPHLHCVVPGGGLSLDGTKWISSRENFFLSVKVLSKVFRGKFLDFLSQAFKDRKLTLQGKLQDLQDPGSWEAELKSLKRTDWVVYAKPPFGGPKQVLKYLARYTHRVAISSERLVSMKDGKVTFRWKDYAHQNRHQEMTLDAEEFIRRFLLHVLPSNFKRIRHYGFLSNRTRKEKLELLRRLLSQSTDSYKEVPENPAPLEPKLTGGDPAPDVCPSCKKGHLLLVRELEPDRSFRERFFSPQTLDTS